MQRLFIIVGIAGAIMAGLYYMASRPVATTTLPPVPVQNVALAPVPQPAPAPPPPSTSTMHAQPAPRVDKKTVGKNQYLTMGKLKFEVNRLVRSQNFLTLNPGATPESLLSGRFSPAKIILPVNMNLIYEVLPRCQPLPTDFVLYKKARNLHKLGFPVFILRRSVREERMSELSAALQRETCLKTVTINRAVDLEQKKKAVIDPGYRQLVDQTLAGYVARNVTPRFLVIGTTEQLIDWDPLLFKSDPKTDHLVESSATYITAKSKPIVVVRRGIQINEQKGERMDEVTIQMGIVRALKTEGNVIALDIPDFDLVDLESVTAFAKTKGAIVVNSVPIPTVSESARQEASSLNTPSKNSTVLKNTINEEGRGGGRGGGGKGRGGGGGKGRGGGGGKNAAGKTSKRRG